MKRLTLTDDLFPVQAFLNAIPDADFVSVLEGLVKNVGRGYDGDVTCLFPESLDPTDQPFEGVELSVGKESIILSRAEFRRYLGQACEAYLSTHPQDRSQVEALLRQWKH